MKSKIILLVIFFSIFLPKTLLAANFGIRPAYPRENNLRTESIFIQTINPEEKVSDGVRVINNTSEFKNFLLYSEDSVRSSGGGFACKQLADPSIGVGTWINFDITLIDEEFINSIKPGKELGTIELRVPPNSEIIIPFTITAPKNVSVGEHNGCILLQEIKEKDPNAVGVSLSLRSGIRVAINIPGEIIKKIEFQDFQIEKRNKIIYLMPSVKNIGNTSIDTEVSVDVRYFFGAKYKTFGGQFPVLRDEVYDF